MNGVGIIAGAGQLPRLLAETNAQSKRPYLIITFDGLSSDWMLDHPHFVAKFEQPEAMFDALRKAGCSEVVMAGATSRPALDPSKFDGTFAGIAPKLMEALQHGDDAGLAVIVRMIEGAGFDVTSAQAILSALLLEAGIFTKKQPDETDQMDAARAQELVDMLGRADVGQGAVVAAGLCYGLETLQGTEALLGFVAGTKPELRSHETRGLYFKAPKPQQDRRADLPAIGPDTVDQVAKAGLGGLVIEANGVLVINRDEVIRRADAAGLFLWSRDAGR